MSKLIKNVNKFYMKKFLYLFQQFIKCSLIFFIAFIWLRFFLKELWQILLSAFIITLVIEIGTFLLTRKKNNSSYLKLKEKEDADDMYFSLINSNYIDFLFNLFSTRFGKIEKKKEYIKIKSEQENLIVYPMPSLDTINAPAIVNIMKKFKNVHFDKLMIICYDYDASCNAILQSYNKEIFLLNRYECYSSIYKEFDFYPMITHKFYKKGKQTFKDLLAYSLNKSRAKGYLISATIIFITSFFVQINLYYCIIATILLLLALISYINPKYNKKTAKNFF